MATEHGLHRWALGLALVTSPTLGLPPIPEQSGWSGYINIGASAVSSENNMVNGIGAFDLGKKRISSLDQSPDNEDLLLPAVYFEAGYGLYIPDAGGGVPIQRQTVFRCRHGHQLHGGKQ